MDPFETPYTPLDVTKRKVLLKLELSGDVPKKLQAVADTVYGISGYQTTQATDKNREWNTTDQVLYSEAKASYDEILGTFKSKPKVYKFESIKEKIWERNKTGGGLEPPPLLLKAPVILSPKQMAEAAATSKGKSKRAVWDNRNRKCVDDIKVPLTAEEEAATYINPFQTVIPNIAIPSVQPLERVEVWCEKLEMLKQLTPREDLEGYEIREDYFDQQKRLAAQADFQQRMRQEIQRREECPTEIEQVEDVLFDSVEAIRRSAEREEKAVRVQAKTAERSTWHPAATGFKMRPLGVTESESGEVTKQVSDFVFSDFMISPTGQMLGVRAPPELFELHDQERQFKLQQELKRLEAEEVERKRPLTEKLRIAVALARQDPAAAARKAASDVLERAVHYPRSVSERLLQHSKQAIARGLAGMMQTALDPQTALENLSESLVSSYRNILQKRDGGGKQGGDQERPKSAGFNSKEPSIRDVERIIAQEEEQLRQREELLNALRNSNLGLQGRAPVPVQHADTVMVTVTLLVSPPPAYVMRPPPSFQRELVRTKKRVLGELRARAKKFKTVLERIEESDTVQIIKKIGRGERSTAFADASVSNVPLNSGRRDDFDSTAPSQIAAETADIAEDSAEDAGIDEELSDAEGSGDDLEGSNSAGEGRDDRDALPLSPNNRRERSRAAGAGGELRNSGREGPLRPPHPLQKLSPPKQQQQQQREQGQTAPTGVDNNGDAVNGPADSVSDEEGEGLYTPRSRRRASNASGITTLGGGGGGGNKSRRSSGATHRTLRGIDEHPLDHEEVHIERLRNKRTFPGYIMPDDLVPKAFKSYGGKLVFDLTARRAFEEQLLAEVADAVSLPVRNISIEEIRRLEIDAPKLYVLQQRKEAMVQNFLHLKQEEQRQLEAQRAARKAYNIALEKFEGLSSDSEEYLRFTAQLNASTTTFSSTTAAAAEDTVLLIDSARPRSSSASASGSAVEEPLQIEGPPPLLLVGDPDVAGSAAADATAVIDDPNDEAAAATGGGVAKVSTGASESASAEDNSDSVSEVSKVLPTAEIEVTEAGNRPAEELSLPESVFSSNFGMLAAQVLDGGAPQLRSQSAAAAAAAPIVQSEVSETPVQSPFVKRKKSVAFLDELLNDAGGNHVTDLLPHPATKQAELDMTATSQGTSDFPASSAERAEEVERDEEEGRLIQTVDGSVTSDDGGGLLVQCSPRSNSDVHIAPQLEQPSSPLAAAGASDGAGALSLDVSLSGKEEEQSDGFGGAESTASGSPVAENAFISSLGAYTAQEDVASSDVDVAPAIANSPIPSHYLRSQPLQPQLFKIGVPNPDEIRHDPSYWLAKRLNDLTAAEKRNYRIARLKLLRKEDELTRRVRQLRQARADLIEDSIDLLAPVVERLQPVVDKLKPIAVRAQNKLLKVAGKCFATLTEMTKDYRGPKMVDLVHFEKVLRSFGQQSVQLLFSGITASANLLHTGSGLEGPPLGCAERHHHHRDILATMQDMLEELEYRCIEDEVEVLLLDMCAHVADQHTRSDIAVLLASMCDSVETAVESQRAAELAAAEEAARLNALLPAVEEPLSEYDFEAIMRQAQKDKGREKSGVMDRMRLLDEQSVDTAEEEEGDEEDEEEEEEGDEGEEDADEDEEEDDEGEEEEEEDGEDAVSSALVEGSEQLAESVEGSTAAAGESQNEQDSQEDEEDEEEDEEEEEEGDEEDDDDDEDLSDSAGSTAGGDSADDESGVQRRLAKRMRKLKALDAEAAQAGQELEQVSSELQAMGSEGDAASALALVPLNEADDSEVLLLEVGALLSDMCDRVELAAVLDDICGALEAAAQQEEEPSIFHDLSEMQMSTASSVGSSTIAENDLSERLVGCEVTFKIFVGKEQRELDGLADIEAEDIAVLLQQQVFDVDSPLYAGLYGKAVVDVQYKVAHKRKQFDNWESFYAHIIHPSFFGYTSKLPKPNKVWDAGDGLVNGRLPSGVAPLNPTLLFSDRTKASFLELNNKPVLRPPWERVKREDVSDDEGTVASSVTGGGGGGSVLDLNMDEFAYDVRKLKLYRPNMSALTAKDIQRLKRLHKAFEERYEEEMRKGLVDGKGLRPEQFAALKDRESAYRIYRTARQKFRHVNKHLSEELVLPPLEVTHIDHATFDGWLDEVRQDDHQRLREARAQAAKRKKVLAQEALLRRQSSQMRFWIIDTFIAACENPLDVGYSFEEEMLKLDIHRELVRLHSEDGAVVGSQDPATEKLLQDLVEKQTTFKKLVISEAKKTRKLFEVIAKWCARQQQHQQQALIVSADLESGGDEQQSSLPVTELSDETTKVSTASESDLGTSEAGTIAPTSLAVDVTAEPVAATRPGTTDTTASRRTDKSGQTADTTGEGEGEHEAPSLPKQDLLAFLEVALRAIAEHTQEQRRAERARVRALRELEEQRRLESLQAFHGRGKPAPAKLAIDTAAATLKEKGDDDNSEEEDEAMLSPLLFSPTPGTAAAEATETTSRFTFAAGSSAIAQLGVAEFALVKDILWMKSIKTYPQFQRCLVELPTLFPNTFARDELVQYATVLCEVEPVFTKVLADLSAAKEASEIALGLRKSKATETALLAKQQRAEKEEKRKARKQAKAAAHQQQLDAAEADAAEAERLQSERLIQEQRKALELVARAAEREKAWFMAHPHKFIRHPGEPAFCIVCKEKETEFWMKQHRETEQAWREGFETSLMDRVEEQESAFRDSVELERREHLTVLAGALVAEEMQAEERAKAEELNPLKKISRSFKGTKLSPLKLLSAARGGTSTGTSTAAATAAPGATAGMTDEEQERAWPRELARIRALITSVGLSLVDPRGKSILPKKPPKKAAIQMYVAPVLLEGEVGEDAELERLGLRIRVWHRDEDGNRANFLGVVSFTEKEMLKPPKGMRTFPLQKDPAVVETDPTPVSGNLVVMLRATHAEHKNGCNTHWRLEIVRANKLSGVDPARGGGGGKTTMKSPSPFCEVYWKGPALRKGKLDEISDWTAVGHTATKQNTDSPVFEKEGDQALLELPPVWTEHDIPRSQFPDHFQEGGGWVARNQVPVPLEEGEEGQKGEQGEGNADFDAAGGGGVSSKGGAKRDGGKRFPFGAKSEEEVVQFRKIVKYNELVSKEVQLRLEGLKYVLNAEERERRCMAQEERQQWSTELSNEVNRSTALLGKQTEYSRAFMRLLHLVQSPPNILARLRFLMGEEVKGGGQKVMCEDPATGKVFNVISTPILRKADEEFILAQMNSLFGISCANLVNIVDFSIHQLRDFNDKGFSSVDERVAIAVLQFIEGCTVMQYLHKHWETLTNDSFRDLLCQIMNAIRCMHQAGILHRNIHPDAIVVELPNSRNVIKKRIGAPRSTPSSTATATTAAAGTSDKRRRTVVKPINDSIVCHLGDYWFLHNPRLVGCSASQGRADWGALATAPPEASSVASKVASSSVLTSPKLHPPNSPSISHSNTSAVAQSALLRIGAAAGARAASGGLRPMDDPPIPPADAHTSASATTNIATAAAGLCGLGGPGVVSDKSDVYAFGVCLYYWATKGIHRTLPLSSAGSIDMVAAKKNIPLKWNTWVHSLLDMCLQLNPANRASSKDIHVFLSSRFGK